MLGSLSSLTGGGGLSTSAKSGAAQRSSDYYGGQQNRIGGIRYNQGDTQSNLVIAAAAIGAIYLLTR